MQDLLTNSKKIDIRIEFYIKSYKECLFGWGFFIKTIKQYEKFHIKSAYCSCLVLKIEFPLHNGGLPTTNLKVCNKDRFTHTGHVTNIFLFKMYWMYTEMHLKNTKDSIFIQDKQYNN